MSAGPAGHCSPEGRTIAFVAGASPDPYVQTLASGAEAQARALGLRLVREEQAATSLSAKTTVGPRPDAVVLAPSNPRSARLWTEQARVAGSVVVAVRPSSVDSGDAAVAVTGDDVGDGARAARALAAAVRYRDDTVYRVAIGLTSQADAVQTARLQGFVAEVKARYPRMSIVDVRFSRGSSSAAAAIASAWLSGTTALDGVVAVDPAIARTAVSRRSGSPSGRSTALIVFDAYPDLVRALRAGAVSAVISRRPAEEGRRAVEAAMAALCGSAPGTPVMVPGVSLDGGASSAELLRSTFVAAP